MASKGKQKTTHNDWKRSGTKYSLTERIMMIRIQKSKFFLSRFD